MSDIQTHQLLAEALEVAAVSQAIDPESIRTRAAEINRLGEMDDALVQQTLYEQEAQAAVAEYWKENGHFERRYMTWLTKVMDANDSEAQRRFEERKYDPIKLPILETGTIKVTPFGAKDAPTLIQVSNEGITIPGFWRNPDYVEVAEKKAQNVADTELTEINSQLESVTAAIESVGIKQEDVGTTETGVQRMFIDGEKSFKFPEEGQQAKIVVLGRNSYDCDVVISVDPNVSQRHLAMRLYPDHQIEIVDLSLNRTTFFVEGTQPKEMIIEKMLEDFGIKELKKAD